MSTPTTDLTLRPASSLAQQIHHDSDTGFGSLGTSAVNELRRRAEELEELRAALLWIFDVMSSKVRYDRSTETVEVRYPHNDHVRYTIVRNLEAEEPFADFALRAFRTRGQGN